MRVQRLPAQQQELVSGAPCAAIAVLVGHAFATAAPAWPTLAQIDARVRLGCDVWATLTSAARGARYVMPGEMLMPAQVLHDVADIHTGAAPWVHLRELVGYHAATADVVPAEWRDVLRETLGGLAAVEPATSSCSTLDAVAYEPVLDGGLAAALSRVDALAAAAPPGDNPTRVAAVTYAGHTIVVVFVYDVYGLVGTAAVDSLRGEWLSCDDDTTAVIRHVVRRWCPPAHAAENSNFVVNVFAAR
jgi:hypothetical protein